MIDDFLLDSFRPALSGRAGEWSQFRDLLDRLHSGHGGLVLISGEAGIGKTALVEALAIEARSRDFLVLTGTAYGLELQSPYGVWQELFREASQVPDLPGPLPALTNPDRLDGVGGTRELWMQVQQFLSDTAALRPVIAVLEDLHWADEPSLDLLRFLARQISPVPALLVATYRDVELTREHPLYRLLPQLVREARPARLAPQPLDRESTGELARSRYPSLALDDAERLTGYLVQYAEGNPLFIQELLALLEHEQVLWLDGGAWRLGELPEHAIPPLVRQVIEERLGRLSPPSRDLLQVAAVIGMEVPLDLWEEISGVGSDGALGALEEAIRARVLEEAGRAAAVRFRHALIQEVVYQSLNLIHRRRLHDQIGEALASRPNADPSAIAHHFLQAGNELAADWLIEAAQRAARAFALQTTVANYERALALLEYNDERLADLAGVLCALAEANRFTDTARALGYVTRAVEISADLDNPGVSVLSRWVAARVRGFDNQNALADLKAAEAVFLELPEEERKRITDSPLGYVASDATLAQDLANYGQFSDAMRRARQYFSAHPVPESRSRYIEFGNAYFGLAIASAALGEPERAREAFDRSRSYFRESGNYQMISNCWYWELNTVLQIYYADQPAERRRAQREEVQANLQTEFVQMPDPEQQVSTSETLILDGQWDACSHIASDRLAIPASWVPSARKLAEIDWLRGFPERAWSHVRSVMPAGPDEPPGRRFFLHRQEIQWIAAELALDEGDYALAERWIQSGERWLDWSGKVSGRAIPELLRARLQAEQGHYDVALQHATEALALASEPRQPLLLLAAHRRLAHLTALSGREEDAQAHLAAAAEIARACEAPYELACTHLAQAEVLLLIGTGDGVDHQLADAREIAERLGARPLLERIEQVEKSAADARPVRAEIPGGLSARELEVLQLVAEGLTDIEIAERLFIVRRTVSGHLQSIYSKLGVNTRTAAVAFAFEHDLL